MKLTRSFRLSLFERLKRFSYCLEDSWIIDTRWSSHVVLSFTSVFMLAFVGPKGPTNAIEFFVIVY